MGIQMKSGQTIDASFVSVPVQRHTREENTVIKEGAVPSRVLIRPARLCPFTLLPAQTSCLAATGRGLQARRGASDGVRAC